MKAPSPSSVRLPRDTRLLTSQRNQRLQGVLSGRCKPVCNRCRALDFLGPSFLQNSHQSGLGARLVKLYFFASSDLLKDGTLKSGRELGRPRRHFVEARFSLSFDSGRSSWGRRRRLRSRSFGRTALNAVAGPQLCSPDRSYVFAALRLHLNQWFVANLWGALGEGQGRGQ